MKVARKKTPRAPRRTAAEARAAILDAAERRLLAVGPAGIRLQDVAADVGVSHPAVLHHFGDREGLVEAVVERAIGTLEGDLVAAFARAPAAPPDPMAFLDQVATVLIERGHARLLAWLLLSGYRPFASARSRENWARITDAAHAERTAALAGFATPSREDTLFTIMLASLAIFGEAIAGPSVFMSAGLEVDPEGPARYRRWLADLLFRHLASGG